MGRPATGQTTPRAVRVPDAVWDRAQAVAEANGETVSEVVRRALREYIATDGRRTMRSARRSSSS